MIYVLYAFLFFLGAYAGGLTAVVLFIRITSGFWLWEKELAEQEEAREGASPSSIDKM